MLYSKEEAVTLKNKMMFLGLKENRSVENKTKKQKKNKKSVYKRYNKNYH